MTTDPEKTKPTSPIPASSPWQGVVQEWKSNGARIFTTDGYSRVQIQRISQNNNVQLCDHRSIEALETHFEKQDSKQNDTLNIVSLNEINSWSPLDITPEMLDCLLSRCQISTEFAETVEAFGGTAMRSEIAYMGKTWDELDESRKIVEFGYTIKFPESKQDPDEKRLVWSLRKIGVCQQYYCSQHRGTAIILLPNYTTKFVTDHPKQLEDSEYRQLLLWNPLHLSLSLIRTYVNNWRAFLLGKEKEIAEQSRHVQGTHGQPLDFHELYTRLTQLAKIEEELSPVDTMLTGLVENIEHLQKMNGVISSMSGKLKSDQDAMNSALKSLISQIRSYQRNATYLNTRIKSISSFLSNTINLRTQNAAQGMSKSMLIYNKVAIRDSSAMRIITVVTMLYLPPTSVATFFSMGAFFYQQNSGGQGGSLATSPLIWTYFVIAVPLTLLTLAFWWWKMERDRKKRDKELGRDTSMGQALDLV